MNDWFGKECSMNGPIVCKKCDRSPMDCECGYISPIMKTEFRLADQLRRVLNVGSEKKNKAPSNERKIEKNEIKLSDTELEKVD